MVRWSEVSEIAGGIPEADDDTAIRAPLTLPPSLPNDWYVQAASSPFE